MAIVARMIVPVFAHLVPINVRITANTALATKPVVIAARLAQLNAAGSVLILVAQNLAMSHAIDQDVTNRAKKSYHVATLVLAFVVRNARNFAEFATKRLMISRDVSPKLCSWNWWTAVMYLK